MNVGRIFAHAVVRRIAYLVVGVFVALLAQCVAEARAACPPVMPSVPGTSMSGTAEGALAECNAFPPVVMGGPSSGWHDRFSDRQCTLNESTKNVTIAYSHIGVWSDCETNYSGAEASKDFELDGWTWINHCPAGEVWNPVTEQCEPEPDCSIDDPPLTGGSLQCATAGAEACPLATCSGGCTYADPGTSAIFPGYTIDGFFWISVAGWVPEGTTCTAGGTTPSPGTPPTDSDGDGASDGNDGAPNNPGDTGGNDPHDGDSGDGDEDGSGTCGGAGQPACDGTNGGSGQGNTSGGGGNCQTPPHSSGDAILAQIAYQTWATRCALEGEGSGPGGDGDQPEWTEGDGPAVPEDTSAEDVENASSWGVGLSTDLLDTENIFGEASCPQLPEFSVMGYEINTASFTWWCTLVSIMRAAILVMGAFTALQILMGRM